MRRAPELIAGGGPAGTAAAILLARGGAMPVLIERSRESHDVVCGGFLGGDAIALLGRLGVDPEALGAPAIRRARLIARRRAVETDLPFAAAGLSRRSLDAALLARATEEGATIERGITIRRVDLDQRRLHLSDETTISANAIFLATGKHEARGATRPALPDDDPALGLRIRLEPSAALARDLAGVIELHLFRGGYAGLLLQEDGGVNLCLSVAQSRLQAAGGQPEQLIAALAREAPMLADRFGAASAAGPWSTVARIPYGWRAQHGRQGIFRLGDQAAVIASLAGDGIAIALDSAIRATHAFLHDGPHAALSFQTGFAVHVRRPVAVANILKHWGETPWIAGPMISVFRHAPGLLRHAAAMTRIGTD
jgi:flavin-dependent dehydrogenase